MTRVFDAPRSLVFDALTKPELVKRWLRGPPGWTMRGLRDRSEGGRQLSLRVARPGRRRDGDGRRLSRDRARRSGSSPRSCSTGLVRRRGGGHDASSPSRAARPRSRPRCSTRRRRSRDAVLKTPMRAGIAAGYDRLDELLASTLHARRSASDPALADGQGRSADVAREAGDPAHRRRHGPLRHRGQTRVRRADGDAAVAEEAAGEGPRPVGGVVEERVVRGAPAGRAGGRPASA